MQYTYENLNPYEYPYYLPELEEEDEEQFEDYEYEDCEEEDYEAEVI